MHKTYNPDGIAAPLSRYSHAVEVPADARRLYVSGQVGVKPDGSIAEGVQDQAEWVWKNLLAILQDAGMGVEDIVKVTTLLTRAEDVPVARGVRERFLGEARPASTLMVISALASPQLLIEIELTAAKA